MSTQVSCIAAMLLSVLLSCSAAPGPDQKFEVMARHYIETYLQMNPETATALGDHRFDHVLYDYSNEGISRELAMQQSYRDSLSLIPLAELSPVNRIDYQILQNAIESAIFELGTLRSYTWNPLVYNPGNAIYSLLSREFAPLPDRMQNVKARLSATPALVEQAKVNLKNAPKIHVETAILQNKGTISLIRDEISIFLQDAPQLRDALQPARDAAAAALEAYGQWLEQELLPGAQGDFRLGMEKFRRKLRYTLDSELTLEDILTRAESDLAETLTTMYQVALPLFQQYFPGQASQAEGMEQKQVIRAVLDRLAEQHPDAESIVELARTSLQECEAFVRAHHLATMPTEPLQIIVMPEFQRGVAVAYCDAPGPLDKNVRTFYAIAPPPADWDAKRVQSFFREYNNYMLKNLTIHEAMPGHYLQIAHSNQFTAPTLLRAVFMSGTFIEGWATYCEQMMVEQGFGGPEVRMQQLKMRLRMIINAIIDQKIHTAGMTEEEAVSLMIHDGFQEEGEAAGKWRRACLTSTQLSTYYIGNIELNDIRKAYEQQHGNDLLQYHDLLLSFGSPAPKYVRKMMGL